jgi:hypothetical protein
MRLPSIRVRTLLLIVIVIALGAGAALEIARLRRLSAYYRWVAEICTLNVQQAAAEVDNIEELLTAGNLTRDQAERLRLEHRLFCMKISLDASREATFEHAASHPWESVPEWPAEASMRKPNSPQVRRLLARKLAGSSPYADPPEGFRWGGEARVEDDPAAAWPDPRRSAAQAR